MLKVEISFIDTTYLNLSKNFTEDEKEKIFSRDYTEFILDLEEDDISLVVFKETDDPLLEILPDKVDFKLFSEDK